MRPAYYSEEGLLESGEASKNARVDQAAALIRSAGRMRSRRGRNETSTAISTQFTRRSRLYGLVDYEVINDAANAWRGLYCHSHNISL